MSTSKDPMEAARDELAAIDPSKTYCVEAETWRYRRVFKDAPENIEAVVYRVLVVNSRGTSIVFGGSTLTEALDKAKAALQAERTVAA